MIICKFDRRVSKNDRPYKMAGVGRFKTSSELEAHRVIKKWNDRGRIKNKINILWRYDFVSCEHATLEDWDNKKIPHHTESNC